jgi:hypothetical protein
MGEADSQPGGGFGLLLTYGGLAFSCLRRSVRAVEQLTIFPVRPASVDMRQSRLDQRAGVNESVADPIALTDQLRLELPAFGLLLRQS